MIKGLLDILYIWYNDPTRETCAMFIGAYALFVKTTGEGYLDLSYAVIRAQYYVDRHIKSQICYNIMEDIGAILSDERGKNVGYNQYMKNFN